ncbi:MAG: DUF4290 domain-containing protein [Bacteroidaceae bacterium]|nr:DUF4290 domain-containing protein [Bacteroidaceae bacterium]MBO7167528.1 DUF4290 domain-containing protein [Bacteroidaceae bacterium]
MQYNTQREQLTMPEYGRSIQKMVDMAVQMADRAERQQCANTIVKIMSGILPATTNKADDEHRLWNHLARIAHYKLDIDYPVDIIPQEEAQAHPAPIPYPAKDIKRRHYGHLVEQALGYVMTLEDEEKRLFFTENIANQMKQNLYIWNKDSMDNALVAQDIERYSNGKLHLDLDNFTFEPVGESPLQRADNSKKRKRRK